MTKRGKWIVPWAPLGLLVALLLACRARSAFVDGDGAVERLTATAGQTKIVNERETVQVVITSTPTPLPRGGYVTRAVYADARTLNPVLAADSGSVAFCALMFEGMLRVDPFTGEWLPNFAERWTVSADGRTYTFALRRDLQWSDGAPITARDAHFSYAALLSGALDTPNVERVSNIEQVEVLDDYTLAVTFAKAGCGVLDALRIGWLPMHAFTDGTAETYDWRELAQHEFNSIPTVFSGPFVFASWERGSRWVQVRNERYWRGAPYLDGVVTEVLDGQHDMIDLLTAGELDVGEGFDPQHLAAVEAQPALRVYKFLADEYDLIAFQLGDPEAPRSRLTAEGTVDDGHGEHPILGDLRVRRAIAYALDRGALIERARLGEGVPLQANVLPTVGWAYNTDLAPRERDLEGARRLLDEAGWRVDAERGVRVRDGEALRLRLHTNAGNQVRETMASLVREQLSAVGIEVDVIALDWTAFREVLFGQRFDMALTGWSNLGTDPHDGGLWLARYDRPGSGGNFCSYHAPEVEALFAAAGDVVDCDQDARAEIYRAIQARLYEDQPYYWIDVPRRLVAIDERVGGANPGPWSLWHNVHEWHIIR
jgi:peptide/nickel transport system substrate-binding protein